MNRWITSAVAALAVSLVPWHRLQAQLSFRSLETRWQAGGDASLLDDLERYWVEMPDGHRWEIKFMAAIERCELGDPGNVALGRGILRSLPSQYDRTGPGRRRLEAMAGLATNCQVRQLRPSIAQSYTTREDIREIAGIAYSNKVFWEGCVAHANGGRRVLRQFDGATPPSFRVYAAADSETATPWARDRVQGALSGAVRLDWPVISGRRVGRFLLTGWGSSNRAEELRTIGDSLEFARRFFGDQLGLPAGDTLFSVYLVPDEEAMWEASQSLHGIPLPDNLIGYSVDADQSIVAIVPRRIHGTARHELVHLLMHRNFPDAPPWLDEGLAALYEVAEMRGDQVVGLPNWRGGVIRAYPTRPALHELLAMSATDFNGGLSSDEERTFQRQSLNHAVARYFLLYLQEQGLLKDVVRGMRRDPLFVPTSIDHTVGVQSTPLQQMSAFVRGRASPAVRNRIDSGFATWLARVVPQHGPADCDAQRE